MEKMVNSFKQYVSDVFSVDSPSGYYCEINKYLVNKIESLGYNNVHITNKGNVELFIEGENKEKNIAIAAHSDTLGLMVRSISGDGTLRVTTIGGPLIPTLDGEYCTIVTRDGKRYSGTILSTSPAVHVFKDSASKPRDADNIIVRIDEKVKSRADVEKLGICAGDYVCYDTKTVITESGFLKSRFIDDKASVCMILSVLEYMKENNIKPKCNVYCYFTNYEEVGHGAASIKNVDEFLAVDMGCVGLDLNGNEYSVSICAKDSSGPYNYELTNSLIDLAKKNDVKYVVDIFPFYGSDASAALRAGVDFKSALIGTGVCASHGMERTHMDGVVNTMKLLLLYLTC